MKCKGSKRKLTYRGSFSQPGLFMKDHLRPLGNPAPPRPRRPESLIVWMIQESPLRRISFVRCQSPRDWHTETIRRKKNNTERLNTRLGSLQTMVMSAISVREDAVLISQPSVSSDGRVSYGCKCTTKLFSCMLLEGCSRPRSLQHRR